MPPSDLSAPSRSKPIAFGLTCWFWERGRYQSILGLAERLNVTLQLKQTRHGLRRDIEGEVSGRDVDQFLAEFARHV